MSRTSTSARMCPEFCEDTAVAAALLGAVVSGDTEAGLFNVPVDLSTPSSSPTTCHSARVPIHPFSSYSRFISGPTRRDSFDHTIDYSPVSVPTLHSLNAGWATLQAADSSSSSSRFVRNSLASLLPGYNKEPGMPRVVENQREKFDTDTVLRRLARSETEVRYAGIPYERPADHRRQAFERDVEKGCLLMSGVSSGIHILLTFPNPRNVPQAGLPGGAQEVPSAAIVNDQLHIRCRMILNGVCVIWAGSIDMHTLDGAGKIEFDTATADAEAARLPREQRRT